jgi:hypothetical protein
VNGETVVCDGGQLAGHWYSVADAPPVAYALPATDAPPVPDAETP